MAGVSGRVAGIEETNTHPRLSEDSLKGPQVHFGDLLPLPLPFEVEVASKSCGLSQSVRRRILRRKILVDKQRETACALNELAGFCNQNQWPTCPQNQAQRSTLARVFRAHAERPLPDRVLPTKEALGQLLQKKTGYSEGLPGALASYQKELVSLPKGQETPCPLDSLLDGENLAYLQHFKEKMMLSEEEQAGVAEDVETASYLDPVLELDSDAYHGFIADLINAGLMAFTTTPKIQIGCFFVTKKGGKLRLVVDARRANRYFKKPPSTLLGSMETWGRLELPEEGGRESKTAGEEGIEKLRRRRDLAYCNQDEETHYVG